VCTRNVTACEDLHGMKFAGRGGVLQRSPNAQDPAHCVPLFDRKLAVVAWSSRNLLE
jgi:hypothetical protein